MLPFFMVRATLKARLIAGTIALVTALVGAMTGLSIYRENAALQEQVMGNTVRMRDGLQQKGMALVRSIALVCERAIAGYDLSFLAEVVGATVGKGSEVIYVIIMDNDRHVLLASDAGLNTHVLSDPAALFAARQNSVVAHRVDIPPRPLDAAPVTEVVAPLQVAGRRWGVLRLGMSEAALANSLAQLEASGQAHNRRSLWVSVSVAACLIVLGAFFASVFANLATRPLAALTHGADQLREGDTDVALETTGPAEFAGLARAFNRMAAAIRERDEILYANLRALVDAKAAAEESSRLKSEFLANVSHELRTPLNAIINVPGIARRAFEKAQVWHCSACGGVFREEDDAAALPPDAQAPCPECESMMAAQERYLYVGNGNETVHFLKRMEQSAAHLLALVNDVLSFAKLEAGRMELSVDEVDTRHILVELLDTVGSLAEGKQITLQMEAADGALSLRADHVKTMQILINLVGNAIKFTPAGGTVRVNITGEPERVRFAVRDTGIGIPKDKHEVIFDSFRQVDGSHTRRHPGSGLGLAICKKLVHLHGGEIGVDSAEGVGSTFFFTLPRRADGALAQQRERYS